MALENDPQMAPTPPSTPVINGKGATSSTDPTYNVRMLMASENASLRELCMAELRHVNEKVEHVEDVQKLHVMYQDRLAIAEAKRIDAIRSVDVAAAATDRERASAQALTLANQLTSSAVDNRSLVATTAAAQATASAQVNNQFNERIFNLEKTQNQGTGEKDQGAANRTVVFAVIGAVVGVIGMCGGLVGVAVALYTVFTHLP